MALESSEEMEEENERGTRIRKGNPFRFCMSYVWNISELAERSLGGSIDHFIPDASMRAHGGAWIHQIEIWTTTRYPSDGLSITPTGGNTSSESETVIADLTTTLRSVSQSAHPLASRND